MAKKRKNTSSEKKQQQQGHPIASKPEFQGFPLHLVADASIPINPSSFWKEVYPERVWVVSNFLTPSECNEWIRVAEASSMEYAAHPATNYTAHRECFRLQQDHAKLAQRLYRRFQEQGWKERLQQAIAPLCGPEHIMGPIGFNPNLRLYKYTKGHSFGKHVDESNQVMGATTQVTVLIYLSACQGGATRFHPPQHYRKQQRNNNHASLAFDPEPGTMLLHVHGEHCLEHEADPVLGGVKYVLRTDVVYGNTPTGYSS